MLFYCCTVIFCYLGSRESKKQVENCQLLSWPTVDIPKIKKELPASISVDSSKEKSVRLYTLMNYQAAYCDMSSYTLTATVPSPYERRG